MKTLQEAVQLSLKDGLSKDCLFIFARALKAFEITTHRHLPPAELRSVFSLWWSAAKPLLPPDADPDEWRFDFENTFAKTNAALGANSLEEAIRRADSEPPPPKAERYHSPKLRRLIAVCYQLQRLQGRSPFFLSLRGAAEIVDGSGLLQVSGWLAGLVRDGILIEVEKGTRRRATRFRFNLPEFVPAGETNSPKPERAAGRSAQPDPHVKPTTPPCWLAPLAVTHLQADPRGRVTKAELGGGRSHNSTPTRHGAQTNNHPRRSNWLLRSIF